MGLVEVTPVADAVAELKLNRPGRLNTLNGDLVNELLDCLAELRDDGATRVIILTGEGKAFCAGADLEGAVGDAHLDPVDLWHLQKRFSECVFALRGLPQPVIAAVNGAATGGGLALALGCDIRIASTRARFGASFVRVGLSGCDMGTSWNLMRVTGTGRAHELMLTGRIFDAEEALRIGVVTQVAEPGDLTSAAISQAESIVRNSPLGVAMTKEVMWAAVSINHLRDAMELENRTQVLLTQTDDFDEAVKAFFQKRQPKFRGS